MQHTVKNVLTADEIKLDVNLMLFYQCTDVEKMLDSTIDPVADFVNAVCADVMLFASQNSYQEFLEKTGELSNLDSFPTLTQRASTVGFSVHKVIYRGYVGSKQTEKLQDEAVKGRLNKES